MRGDKLNAVNFRYSAISAMTSDNLGGHFESLTNNTDNQQDTTSESFDQPQTDECSQEVDHEGNADQPDCVLHRKPRHLENSATVVSDQEGIHINYIGSV